MIERLTMPAAPRISVFPKCWFDDFVAGTRDYLAWIREAPSLGGEGVEHYDGFLRSFDAADVDPVVAALAETPTNGRGRGSGSTRRSI